MKIHLYSIAWNEAVIMPHFMRHYRKFCEKITVYDNESTDQTADIVRQMGGEVKSWSSNNQINDLMYLEIKQNAYKESRGKADWVIVCDSDEFLYHPNFLGKLYEYKSSGINFPKIEGYEMIPDCKINSGDDLPSVYKQGVRFANLDKRAIFNPKLDINYTIGCHGSNIPVDAIESTNSEIKMLQYKMLNLDYFINRHQLLGSRLSEVNRKNNWGLHYMWTPERMKEEYNRFLLARTKVI